MLIDVILILILVCLILSGYRRGLLMSLMGLVIVVLCCLGAAAAQGALTPTVTTYLEPKIAAALEPEVESYIAGQTQAALDDAEEQGLTVDGEKLSLGDLAELLEDFGLDVDQTITDGVTDALQPATDAVAESISHVVARRIAGTFVYVAAWIILYLVLHNIALALNVVDRLPVIHTCNRLGGAVLGALEGLIPMVVIAAVCDGAGLLPEKMGPFCETVRQLAQALL